MAKIKQDNMEAKKNRKTRSVPMKADPVKWASIYKDVFDMEGHAPIPFLKKLAVDLVEWAINDAEAFKVSSFLTARRIAPQKFRKWVTKHDFLQEADSFARNILGDKRERKGLENDWNTQIVLKTMHLYDPEWKQSEEWRATLSANIAAAQQPFKPLTAIELADGTIIKLGVKDDEPK